MIRWRKVFRQGWQTTYELRAGRTVAHRIQTHFIPPLWSRLRTCYRHELRFAHPWLRAQLGVLPVPEAPKESHDQ